MIVKRPINKADLDKIVDERNKILETLRTPFFLNYDQQDSYYNEVLCDRNSKTRYFIFQNGINSVAMGGVENIEWENSRGEISILVYQGSRRKGFGSLIVDEIIDYGFNYLNLNILWGECYFCGNISFWNKYFSPKMTEKKNYSIELKKVILPDRKFYNGKYHDSLYFSLRRV